MKSLYVKPTGCPVFKQNAPVSVPELEILRLETVEGNAHARSRRGRQAFKRAYCCCSFHSGFDCLFFDLVWGSHVVQCYPSQSLPSLKLCCHSAENTRSVGIFICFFTCTHLKLLLKAQISLFLNKT